MAKPQLLGVEYICGGIACGKCDSRETCNEGFFEFTDAEKIAALIKALGGFGITVPGLEDKRDESKESI